MNVIIAMDSLKLVLLINNRMISINIYDSEQSSKYHLTECLLLKYQFPPTNYQFSKKHDFRVDICMPLKVILYSYLILNKMNERITDS